MSAIQLGDLKIELIQKDIKNVHLSVLPPHGSVRISAPLHLNESTIRLYAISKLAWIRNQQYKVIHQARESKREFINKESHYYLGKRFLLRVKIEDAPPKVQLNGRTYLDLHVRPNTSQEQRQVIMNEWYRAELKKMIPSLLHKWEKKIGVSADDWGVKKMKTRWGTCNIEKQRIWFNLELAKKPLQCLEYILVHELVHLLERRHNERFMAYMDKFMPQWRHYREELNRLPISHADWVY